MSDRGLMRIRSLPNGGSYNAEEVGFDGNTLHLNLLNQPAVAVPPPGALVEVESESALYLGEVRQSQAPSVTVFIEHSLDRARLAAIQNIWG